MKESFEKHISEEESKKPEMTEKFKEVVTFEKNDERENIIKKEDAVKKEKIKKVIERINTTESEKNLTEIKKNYTEKYLPDYLKKETPSFVYKIFKFLSKFSLKEITGKENLPSEEKLFIANHRGGESGRLIAALDRPVHLVSAETINWKDGSFLKWFLQKIGAIPIKESFSHLSDNQKQEVVKRAPKSEREAHSIAIKNKGFGNLKNIRAMVSILIKGEDLAIFTEGPFSRLEEDERKSYAGYALIAREYKKITGKDLKIIPTGIKNGKVSFGEVFFIDSTIRQSKEELENIATEKIHSLYDAIK